jgi:hypothetical protein
MPAALVTLLKLLFTYVVLPMITKYFETRAKVKKKVEAYKAKKADAIKKADEFENNPTDDGRNSLP